MSTSSFPLEADDEEEKELALYRERQQERNIDLSIFDSLVEDYAQSDEAKNAPLEEPEEDEAAVSPQDQVLPTLAREEEVAAPRLQQTPKEGSENIGLNMLPEEEEEAPEDEEIYEEIDFDDYPLEEATEEDTFPRYRPEAFEEEEEDQAWDSYPPGEAPKEAVLQKELQEALEDLEKTSTEDATEEQLAEEATASQDEKTSKNPLTSLRAKLRKKPPAQEAAQEEEKEVTEEEVSPEKPEVEESKPSRLKNFKKLTPQVEAFKKQLQGLKANHPPAPGEEAPQEASPEASKELTLSPAAATQEVEAAPGDAESPKNSENNKLRDLGKKTVRPYFAWEGLLVKWLGKLLALLGRLPLVGKALGKISQEKVLPWVARLLTLVLLALLIRPLVSTPPAPPVAAYSKQLPDAGSFVLTKQTYNPATGEVTALLQNTGDIIVETTPTATISGIQRGWSPSTWHKRKTLTTCQGPQVTVAINSSTTLNFTCPKVTGQALATTITTTEDD